jgi:hypothetical protein
LSGIRENETWRSGRLAPDGRPGLVEYTKPSTPEPTTIYIPRDHQTTEYVIETYFKYLNIHRPVFTRTAFLDQVNQLYANNTANDPGFLCSFYLILALGTLYIVSQEQQDSSAPLFGNGWPVYRDFFSLALNVEQNLRITTSSIQALILLHWYLYTEVGNQPISILSYLIFLFWSFLAPRSCSLETGRHPYPALRRARSTP